MTPGLVNYLTDNATANRCYGDGCKIVTDS